MSDPQSPGSRAKMDALRMLSEEAECRCVARFLIGWLLAEKTAFELLDIAQMADAWHQDHAPLCQDHIGETPGKSHPQD